eukprot:GILJ01011716.1.p2 GENE.GILJ01011716.1~~GILJ01011716.1.p2  ORF type:complete len:115 (-),score=7.92 GILJ01011716.1:102-446(-)
MAVIAAGEMVKIVKTIVLIDATWLRRSPALPTKCADVTMEFSSAFQTHAPSRETVLEACGRDVSTGNRVVFASRTTRLTIVFHSLGGLSFSASATRDCLARTAYFSEVTVRYLQ